MRKLAFLVALIMAFAVAGMASAAPVTVTIDGEDFNDGSQTGLGTLADGDTLKIDTTALDAAGWANLAEAIADWADANAGDAFELELEDQVDIPAGAFKDVKVISDLTLDAAVETIGDSAFEGTTKLTTVTLIAAVDLVSVGAGAFKNSGITAIDLSASGIDLEEIGAGAFEGAKDLASVTFATGSVLFTEIPDNAFKGCKALATVTNLPPTVSKIGKSAFEGTSLAAFPTTTALSEIGESAFKGIKGSGVFTVVAIGNRIEVIPASAFEGCEDLATLTLTNATKLTTISDNAFKGAKALTTITDGFENTKLESIGAGAFEGTKLANAAQSIKFQETLTTIGAKAFAVITGSGAMKFEFRSGTDEDLPATPAEVAEVLAAIDMKDALKCVPGSVVANLKIEIADNAGTTPLGDLLDAVFVVDDPKDADTKAIVEALAKAGFTSGQIVTLCKTGTIETLSAATVKNVVDGLNAPSGPSDPGSPTDPGGPSGPSDPGGPGAAADGGSSGCDVTGLAPLAALLALGLAKVRKPRG